MREHVFVHDSNHKGNVAEAAIAFHAAKLDIPVFAPLIEHCRYDLVLEIGGELRRVQCKWASRRGDVIPVNLVTNRRGPEGFVRSRYTANEIDAVVAYCEELDACYTCRSHRSQAEARSSFAWRRRKMDSERR